MGSKLRVLLMGACAMLLLGAVPANFDLGEQIDAFTGAAAAPASPSAERTPDPNAAAPNYQSRKQESRNASAKVGALGHKGGASHYREIYDGYRWAACRPVPFVINPARAPKGAVADFRLAIAKLRQATGLDLRVVGTTNARPTIDWAQSAGQAEWRPVMVAWGGAGTGVLTDRDASGTAAAWGTTGTRGEKVYVSGQIVFNPTYDYEYPKGFGQFSSRVVLHMHEISHILGLDHVDDPNQMMYTTVAGVRDAGAGDLAGLRKIGQGGCPTVPAP